MDEFFQKLRKIQKKERNESGLARVGDDFYKRVHRYLEELMDTVGNDPFAKEQYLLRDTQRIATEICERREHKITDSAVMNIQRSYHLFKGKPQFDLQDTTPLNLTPEEEQLYFSLIDTLKGYRDKLIPSLEVFDEKNPLPLVEKESGSEKTKMEDTSSDEGLNILNQIRSSSKPLKSSDSHSEDSDKNLKSENIENSDSKPLKVEDSKPLKAKYDGFPDLDGSLSDYPSDPEPNASSYEEKNNQNFHPSKSSENLKDQSLSKLDLKTMVVFEELPSIVGVDEKVYGPFYPQDVIIIPEANAQLFIKARKGRLIRS